MLEVIRIILVLSMLGVSVHRRALEGENVGECACVPYISIKLYVSSVSMLSIFIMCCIL